MATQQQIEAALAVLDDTNSRSPLPYGYLNHEAKKNRVCLALTAAEAVAEPVTWQPINRDTPEMERLLVCGWQPKNGGVAGYWWWHEDAVYDGEACEHPHATHWAPIRLPEFPTALPKPPQEAL